MEAFWTPYLTIGTILLLLPLNFCAVFYFWQSISRLKNQLLEIENGLPAGPDEVEKALADLKRERRELVGEWENTYSRFESLIGRADRARRRAGGVSEAPAAPPPAPEPPSPSQRRREIMRRALAYRGAASVRGGANGSGE
jgi:uncharacterized membrane protein YccC